MKADRKEVMAKIAEEHHVDVALLLDQIDQFGDLIVRVLDVSDSPEFEAIDHRVLRTPKAILLVELGKAVDAAAKELNARVGAYVAERIKDS